MPAWAVITTSADLSIKHFPAGTHVYLYDNVHPGALSVYETIYFRDPFNTGLYRLDSIGETVAAIVQYAPNAYYVDGVRSLDDLLIEDKWRQYALFGEYMPPTKLLESPDEINQSTLAKKRISARARDIIFQPLDIRYALDNYILQKRLTIQDEYRIYIVCGEIQPLISRKTSKTRESKVKVQRLEELPDDIKALSESITSKVPQLDFFGLDIAKTNDGLKLIELNRSPQFSRYSDLGGGDLIGRLEMKMRDRLRTVD